MMKFKYLIACTIINLSMESVHKNSNCPVANKNKKSIIFIAYFYFYYSAFHKGISLHC